MGNLERPRASEEVGRFGRVEYVRHRGRFTGSTARGPYSVPYEVTAPLNAVGGNNRLVFEPPHFADGLNVRNVILGPRSIFGRGFAHASVGYGNNGLAILDARPGFEVVLAGRPYSPAPPVVEDFEIMAQFVGALRENPHNLVGRVEKVYGIGFSNSGRAVREVLRQPFGQNLFDFSIPGNTGPFNSLPGRGRVMVFNTEFDWVPVNETSPDYRRYAVAGGPHIPDCEELREQIPPGPQGPPPIAGTTPLNWLPFLRALFVAGDRWVTEGVEPPPSVVLKLTPAGDQIARDARGNALGGIRHPALELGEARFLASVGRQPGNWRLYGGYDNVVSVGAPGFQKNFGQYVKAFNAAAKALERAGLLLDEDERRLSRQAMLNPQATFTQNYQAGLFAP